MTEQNELAASRLLLVDDEPIIVATIADCLRRAGFDVTATTSAKEAVEFVRQGSFALAIIDYAMPDLNGLEAAVLFAQLRQPFMFLSAYSEAALVSAAVSAGALAYVVKPIDPIHLIPTVRTAISRAREIAALVEHNVQLTRTIDSNRDVSVAVGLLMAQHGLPRQAAYDMLRQHARRTRRRLADLASEVAAGAEALFKVPAPETVERRTTKTGAEPDDIAT
ncbi:MAG: ANTAR domain-containing response regulator [Steroidobacteraceae bacterium]